jgi:hypothetical protein
MCTQPFFICRDEAGGFVLLLLFFSARAIELTFCLATWLYNKVPRVHRNDHASTYEPKEPDGFASEFCESQLRPGQPNSE